MKYEWRDILPHERPMIEKFEDEIIPYMEREGPRIGEFAMSGDLNATEIINRYRLFCEGVPEMRPANYKLLVKALKHWQNGDKRSLH